MPNACTDRARGSASFFQQQTLASARLRAEHNNALFTDGLILLTLPAARTDLQLHRVGLPAFACNDRMPHTCTDRTLDSASFFQLHALASALLCQQHALGLRAKLNNALFTDGLLRALESASFFQLHTLASTLLLLQPALDLRAKQHDALFTDGLLTLDAINLILNFFFLIVIASTSCLRRVCFLLNQISSGQDL
jgi:hypothetical protein